LKCWQKILYFISPKDNIIELGCGAGQFAHMMYDKKFRKYMGVDFSKPAIKLCKDKKLPFKFKQSNFFSVNRISDYKSYDTVILLEVLEHIDHDLHLLDKIDAGTKIIFSVPDFDCPNHVRHFDTQFDVRRRYGQQINIEKLIKVKHIYIGVGRKNSNHIINGDNVSVEPGVAIGTSSLDINDGLKLPQTGSIIIGDNVTIGANTVIARGRDINTPTIIENNVHIGPLANIGHGCHIGKNSVIEGNALVSGFVTIGKNSIIGPNSSIRNRVNIGSNVIVGQGAVVTKHVPTGVIVVGNPAKVLKQTKDKVGKKRDSL
jgi:acetyltransferase-like isoleucine patch superfamily enzyme